MDFVDKNVMEDLKTKLRLAEQSKDALKKRVEELLAERDKTRLDLCFEEERRCTAENERDEAQKKAEEQQAQIESLKLKNTNLKLEASNGKWQASRLNERYIDACVKVEELEEEIKKLEKKLLSERDIRMDAQKDERNWREERDLLLKENDTLHKELEKMAVENHALNAQCNHLTDELLRTAKAHDELRKEEFKRRVNELFGQAKKEQPVFFTADSDAVNHPSHYTKGGIECIEAIKASMTPEAFKGYLKGNSIKYLWRYKEKGYPLQDLEKAIWYTKRLINEEGEE